VADRIVRCINASVAVSASELKAMSLPTAEQSVAAAHEADFGAAVSSVYRLGLG
jgi:adenine-specific DNA-methyltransferase